MTNPPRALALLLCLAALAFACHRANAQVRVAIHDGAHWSTHKSQIPLEINSIASGDLDGDGRLDLVLALNTNGIRVCFSGGNSTFLRFTEHGIDPARSVAIGDVDGDGDIDLLLANGLHINDGIGGYTLIGSVPADLQTLAVTNVAGAAALLDIDGDGQLEIAGVRDDNTAFVWRDTGGFVFTDATANVLEPHTQLDWTVSYRYLCCHAADLDGDGKTDLVTGGSEGRGTSSTTIGVPPRMLVSVGPHMYDVARSAMPHIQGELHDLDAGDIDGDGDTDLIINGRAILWQDAAGLFSADASAKLLSGRARFGDVDGDGDLDMLRVGTFYVQSQPRLELNDGNGNFTDVTLTNLPAYFGPTASLALGDVDGDGDLDAAIGSQTYGFGGQQVQLWLNDGTGGFVDATAQLPAMSIEAYDMLFADLDGDLDQDLLISVGANSGGAHMLLQNDGNGNFLDVTATSLPATTGRGLDVRDLDADGDLDVALSGNTLVNNGGGIFAAAAGATNRVLSIDLDDDGQFDDVLATSSGIVVAGQVLHWGYDGIGTNVFAVDLDGDSDDDLVVGGALNFGYGSSFYRSHIGVLYNLRRDLDFTSLPRLGQQSRVSVRACGNGNASTLAFVAMATSRLSTPIHVPGLGILHLDPAMYAPLGLAVITDADASVELGLFVPNNPTLVGVELSSQALFWPVGNDSLARLSAVVTRPITL